MSSNVAAHPQDQLSNLLEQLGDHLNSPSGCRLEGYASASGIAKQLLDTIYLEQRAEITKLLSWVQRVYGKEWSGLQKIKIGDKTISPSSPDELLEMSKHLNLLPELDKALSAQAIENYRTADES